MSDWLPIGYQAIRTRPHSAYLAAALGLGFIIGYQFSYHSVPRTLDPEIPRG